MGTQLLDHLVLHFSWMRNIYSVSLLICSSFPALPWFDLCKVYMSRNLFISFGLSNLLAYSSYSLMISCISMVSIITVFYLWVFLTLLLSLAKDFSILWNLFEEPALCFISVLYLFQFFSFISALIFYYFLPCTSSEFSFFFFSVSSSGVIGYLRSFYFCAVNINCCKHLSLFFFESNLGPHACQTSTVPLS